MKKPAPEIGLVIRYDFLWSHERAQGRIEGAKERPCVIVAAILRHATGETEVLVVPITHTPPGAGTVAIAIPAPVGRHLGLDDTPSYILAEEANSVAWDDPGIVPARPAGQWAYGRIPKGLYQQLHAAMLQLVATRKLKTARRKNR